MSPMPTPSVACRVPWTTSLTTVTVSRATLPVAWTVVATVWRTRWTTSVAMALRPWRLPTIPVFTAVPARLMLSPRPTSVLTSSAMGDLQRGRKFVWGEIVNIELIYHEFNVNFIDSAEIAGWHWFRVMADPHEPFGWTSLVWCTV